MIRWSRDRGVLCRTGALLGALLSTFLLTPRGVFALEEEQAGRRLTVERIFERGEFETESWGPTLWLAGGTTYTTLEDSATLEGVKDVVGHDPASGAREILVAGDRLRPEGAAEALKIADYQWSQDRRRLLLFTNTKRVWRQNTRGDYWVYDRREGTLRQLGGTAPASSLMFASFSPGGDRVAYVRDNDLFVQHLGNMRIRRVTTDGGPDRINGTSDWVNEEELGLRQAYRWSPDGRWLAYWQFDTSGVSRFQLIDNTQGLYPAITSFPYPKVGQTNSACRVGVVRARGGRTRWIRTEGNPRDHYIAGLEWTPDSRRLVLQQLNRLQNTNRVWVGEVGTGRARVVHTDSDEAWVEAQERWQWLEEGRAFLWLSEREGWRHLYAVPVDGSEPRRLTSGEWDVIGLAGMDEEHGWVYVIASPDNPTQRYLYRVPLGGEGGPERVTPEDQAGTHTYELAEGARWAIRTVSRFGVPPVTDLVHLPEHESVRVLAEHAELHAKLGGLEPCDREFFRVGVGEGLELDGWCIKPPKFDPKGKYPLLVYVYGEPAGQTVLDRWGGNTYLWHWMLAQHGYVVVSVDNRGTPAPRGRSWRKAIYRQVGILAPGEQAAAVRQLLATRPYLDPDRVGVWGWSGGGSMSLNAIFRYPELYRAAVAVAFVSDQRLYDTIYQERYMGLPEDNENGYRDGSPIHHAHRLEGDLLLIHGTADDNCHYQHCEVLINELVKRHKAFSLLAYPNRTHGITEGDGTRRHLYESMTRFLQEHLRPSP